MIDLVTRYVIAVDNTGEERKRHGHVRRYVRAINPGSLTIDCEKARRWETREEAQQIADKIPNALILDWLLPR